RDDAHHLALDPIPYVISGPQTIGREVRDVALEHGRGAARGCCQCGAGGLEVELLIAAAAEVAPGERYVLRPTLEGHAGSPEVQKSTARNADVMGRLSELAQQTDAVTQ